MGEIRSTLDIIMEKTKGLILTEEEKKQMRLKELEDDISKLFRRYENNVISEEDMILALKSMIEKDRHYVFTVFKSKAIDLIKISNKEIKGISLFKKLFPQLSQRMEELSNKTIENLELKEKEITKREIFNLKKQEIEGDAIVINMDVNPEWKQLVEVQEKQLKEEILKAIDSWADENNF